MVEGTSLLGIAKRFTKKSPVRNAPEIVLVGPDGNLYLAGDSNRTQDQHLGKLLMSDERVAQWRGLMKNRAAWMGGAGIEFVFMIGPDKQSVYWGSMGIGRRDHRNSLLVFEDLTDVVWIDPVPALAMASQEPPVFPFNDSHYDSKGAFVAYSEIFSRLRRGSMHLLVEGEHFKFAPIQAAGDLGNKFSLNKMGSHQRLKRLKMTSRLIYNNGVPANGGMRIHFNPKASGIGFLCGDSYTQNIVPFVAEHFRILVHLRGPVDEELIRAAHPDTVIGMIAERFMIQEPVLLDEIPFEMLFIRKLARGEIESADLARGRTRLSRDELPSVILAAVMRQEALIGSILDDGPEGQGGAFLEDIFEGAVKADVLVAAYLAWVRGRKLREGWRCAYEMLPDVIRRCFEVECSDLR